MCPRGLLCAAAAPTPSTLRVYINHVGPEAANTRLRRHAQHCCTAAVSSESLEFKTPQHTTGGSAHNSSDLSYHLMILMGFNFFFSTAKGSFLFLECPIRFNPIYLQVGGAPVCFSLSSADSGSCESTAPHYQRDRSM